MNIAIIVILYNYFTNLVESLGLNLYDDIKTLRLYDDKNTKISRLSIGVEVYTGKAALTLHAYLYYYL